MEYAAARVVWDLLNVAADFLSVQQNLLVTNNLFLWLN